VGAGTPKAFDRLMKLNKQETATLFRVSPTEVDRWIKSGLPCTRKGRSLQINIMDTHLYLMDRLKSEYIGEEDGEVLNLDNEKAKLAKAQSTRINIDIDQKRSELLDKTQIRTLISNTIIRNKAHLLKLAPKISDRLNLDRKGMQMISRMIEEVLEGMALGVPDE